MNNITQSTTKSNIFKSKVSTSLKVEQIVNSFIEFYQQSHSKEQLKRFYKGWLILCPFHNDSKPSLAIYQNGTTWCFSEWRSYKLKAVLKSYNFIEDDTKEEEDKELSPNLSKLQTEDWIIIDHKQYLYTDGEKTFIRVRVDLENTKTKARRKEFYFYQPTFKNGEQVLELVRGYVPLILYRLTEIESAQSQGVIFVEGEKCVDALVELGLVATTLPVGSTVKPSKELYEALIKLKGKTVFIMPDNDKGGWEYARMIKQVLSNLEIQSEIIAVPKIGEKSDIADYIELQTIKGKTKEEIRDEILSWVASRLRKATIQLISSLETKRIKETLPNPEEKRLTDFVYQGITLFAGAPKAGKTFFLIQKAYELAEKGYKVVYLALDENKLTFIEKLTTLGLEDGHENFYYYTRDDALEAKLVLRLDEGGLNLLEEVADTYAPDALIVDIWENIRPISQKNKNKDAYSQDYEAITTLRKLQSKIKAIIICHHLKKAMEIDPLNRALGSVGLLGAVDSIIILDRKRGESRGKLLFVSRYAPEIDLAMAFENGRWTVLGDAWEYELAEEQRKIVETIKSLGGKATLKELIEATGKNKGTLKATLFKMTQKGILKREARGEYTLCNNEVNLVNQVNQINLVNQVNQPPRFTVLEESKPSSKPPEGLENQGSAEMVYSVYSVYSGYDQSKPSTPIQPPVPEEEEFFLLMPENEKCNVCGCEVWKVQKDIYRKGKGTAICAKCGHMSWFGSFTKGQVLESNADVEYFLADLPS